jgi:hypothetical protein
VPAAHALWYLNEAVRKPRRVGLSNAGYRASMDFFRQKASEVSVTGCGCCLPIPLLVVTGTIGGGWALWRRWRRA